ncbi:hypothetical protein CSIRO_3469 [Bradyrhizobiaceae bacterium SG-6C]|nr:hypothetical protein CSIRO_3469 [Bradyrhizobiaceae bacterium SG-6C]
MLHCSHEHDRTIATGALQPCDKQPCCDVCARDTTPREKIFPGAKRKRASASVAPAMRWSG